MKVGDLVRPSSDAWFCCPLPDWRVDQVITKDKIGVVVSTDYSRGGNGLFKVVFFGYPLLHCMGYTNEFEVISE